MRDHGHVRSMKRWWLGKRTTGVTTWFDSFSTCFSDVYIPEWIDGWIGLMDKSIDNRNGEWMDE